MRASFMLFTLFCLTMLRISQVCKTQHLFDNHNAYIDTFIHTENDSYKRSNAICSITSFVVT